MNNKYRTMSVKDAVDTVFDLNTSQTMTLREVHELRCQYMIIPPNSRESSISETLAVVEHFVQDGTVVLTYWRDGSQSVRRYHRPAPQFAVVTLPTVTRRRAPVHPLRTLLHPSGIAAIASTAIIAALGLLLFYYSFLA